MTTTAPDAPSTATVRLVDFGFEDLPESVPAGTKLEIVNESTVELHELVAFRLPDDEQRPLSELMALPQPEVMSIMGEPKTVLLTGANGLLAPACLVGIAKGRCFLARLQAALRPARDVEPPRRLSRRFPQFQFPVVQNEVV